MVLQPLGPRFFVETEIVRNHFTGTLHDIGIGRNVRIMEYFNKSGFLGIKQVHVLTTDNQSVLL